MIYFRHADATAILTRLAKEQVTALYHFTSVENLPYICARQALCSKEIQESEGRWPPPIPGGNNLSHNLDRYNGNWDKVSLSFTPFTPMVYGKKRKNHLCFFAIEPEVATWSGVIFTDSNAAGTTMQRRGEGLAGINLVNFEAIRSKPKPWDKEGWFRQVQAELLVPSYIPLSYIRKVTFISRASLLHAERLCDSISHPPFVVEENLFTDSSKAPSGAIGFPFIDQLALSETKIDSNMLYLIGSQKNTYSKKSHNNIYLTMIVRALIGTKISIYLHPIDRPKVTQDCIRNDEFSREGRYLMGTNIVLDSLVVSKYLLEILLDNVCRASIAFELLL